MKMNTTQIRETINDSNLGRIVNSAPTKFTQKIKEVISDIKGADYSPLKQLVPVVGLAEIYRKEKAGEEHVWSHDSNFIEAYTTCLIHAAPFVVAGGYLVDCLTK